MWLMLQQDKPEDYVIGTGESHSVREFVEYAFNYAGIEIEWKGEGINQKGIVKSLSSTLASASSSHSSTLTLASPSASTLNIGDVVIEIDPRYFRPTEADYLLADTSKARERLGWTPRVTFKELARIMVDCDMELLGLDPPGEGKKILTEKGINWTENKLTRDEDKDEAEHS